MTEGEWRLDDLRYKWRQLKEEIESNPEHKEYREPAGLKKLVARKAREGLEQRMNEVKAGEILRRNGLEEPCVSVEQVMDKSHFGRIDGRWAAGLTLNK